GPVEYLHPSVEVLHQRGTAFDPVAVVEIFDPVEVAHFGGVDMPADHSVDAAFAGRAGHHLLVTGYELDRVLDLVLGHLGKRPVGKAELAAHRIDPLVRAHQQMVGRVPDEGEPAMSEHDRVELVAMQHHKPPPVGRIVKGGAADFDTAETQAGELAEHLVVIAGNIDDPRAAPGALEDPPDDIIMCRRPVELLLEPPAVDDVANEIERFAVRVVEEVDQQFGVAALGPEMDVADPDGTEFPPLHHARFADVGARTGNAPDRRNRGAGIFTAKHRHSPNNACLWL